MYLKQNQFKIFVALLLILLLPLAVLTISDAASELNQTSKKPLRILDGTPISSALLPGQSQELVILVPALDSNQSQLKSLKRELYHAGYTTFTFDFPGQGRSWGKMPSDTTACIDQLAQALYEIDYALYSTGIFNPEIGFHYVVFDSTSEFPCQKALQKEIDASLINPQSVLYLNSHEHNPATATTAKFILDFLENFTNLSNPNLFMPYPMARTIATILSFIALFIAGLYLILIKRNEKTLPDLPPTESKLSSLSILLISNSLWILAIPLALATSYGLKVAKLPQPQSHLFIALLFGYLGILKLILVSATPKNWGFRLILSEQSRFKYNPLFKNVHLEALRLGIIFAFIWLLTLILNYRLSISWVLPFNLKQPWIFVLALLTFPAFYLLALEQNHYRALKERILAPLFYLLPLYLVPLICLGGIHFNSVYLHHLILLPLTYLLSLVFFKAKTNPIQTGVSLSLCYNLFLLSVSNITF